MRLTSKPDGNIIQPKMSLEEQKPNCPKESLRNWVTEEVKRRWNAREHEPFYSVDFPQRIIPAILDIVSTQSEAEAAIDILFSELHERLIETKLDCYHSHAIALEFESYICTDHAYSLAQDPERLYQRLCERIPPSIETTGKVLSKLFGPEIASRAESALDSIPSQTRILKEGSDNADDVTCRSGWLVPLQRKAIHLIREQGIGSFEELCSETARILKDGRYLAKVWRVAGDHHGYPWEEYSDYYYHSESLAAAEQYLRDNGILEQE